MAMISQFSRPTSCSTSTRSTITWVKTGRSMARRAGHDRQPDRPPDDRLERPHERPQPGRAGRLHRRLGEGVGVIEQRGVAAPAALEVRARQPSQPQRGIGDPHVALGDVVEHDPVVALPVHDGRERHEGQVAGGGLDGSGGQAQLGRRTAQRPQARAVGRGEAELADAGQADRAPVVPAHHGQRRGPAVHGVQLAHVREASDALGALDEAPLRRREGRARRLVVLRLVLVPGRFDLARADLLLDAQLGRQRLLGEVQRHARHHPVVVLRDALLELGAELRVGGQQAGEGRLGQAQQPAGRHRLDGGRARLALEQRQLAEEVAAPEIADVATLAVLLHEHAQPPLLDDVHRPRRIALADDQRRPAPRLPTPARPAWWPARPPADGRRRCRSGRSCAGGGGRPAAPGTS